MYTLAFFFLLIAWLSGLHLGPWVSWHSELWVFVASCSVVIGLLAHNKEVIGRSLAVPMAALVWPSLALIAAIQFLVGRIDFHGDVAVLSLYFWVVFLAVCWGYATSVKNVDKLSESWTDRNILQQFSCVVVLGATLSTFIAIVQTLDIWSDVEWIARGYSLRRPGGNISQPNQLATLQLMGIVSLAYLFEKRVLRGIATLLLYVVLIAGVGLTESRTGILSSIVVAVFTIAFRKKYFGGWASVYAIGGLCLLVACFLFLPFASQYLQQVGSAGSTTLSANLAAGTRLQIWPQLLDASLLHPWLGWGLRQVPMAHNAVLHNYPVGEAFTYAHSIILDLILGLGYPLALVFMALIGVWLVTRLRGIQDITSWYCMALLIPFGIHSLFEFPFAYAYFLLPAGFAVGVLEAKLAPLAVVRAPIKLAVGVAAAMLALMLWSVYEYIQIEEDFRVARMEALRIGKTPASYDRPHLVLFDQMDAMLTVIRLVPEPGMDADTIELSRKVAMRFPWVATQNRYALILALNGNSNEAVRQLKVIRAMHGEKTYAGIKTAWQELASNKYPQLTNISTP